MWDDEDNDEEVSWSDEITARWLRGEDVSGDEFWGDASDPEDGDDIDEDDDDEVAA